MSLTVYNTLSGKREPFRPRQQGKVGIYACGVTVYDHLHIGHAMQAIIYDVMRNYFEYLGYEVTYVRNHTDVDDKIIERAKLLGIPALDHSENMIAASTHDLALLGVKPANIEPKVSDHIPEIIALIERLIEGKHAYAAGGDVYYDVRSSTNYGCLSNRSIDDMRSGARVEVNPNKRDPLDFALWKGAKEGEVSWPSPWGEGRPGWHIECSAMAMKYLGETLDIHGGGKDLIFPHHENEIAQSEAATGKPFANFWIHNGLVTVEGRKMSKSFNNFMTIGDALEQFYPETIRYTILSHHYSANIDFSEKSFYDAYSRLMYFYSTLKRLDELAEQNPDYPQTTVEGMAAPDLEGAFRGYMNDDFNTVCALREIGLAFKFINELLSAKKPKLNQKLHTLVELQRTIKRCLTVLGLCAEVPDRALADIQGHLVKMKNIDTARVEALLGERTAARTQKDWQRSDAIRDQLIAEGIQLMDGPEGTVWQVQP